MFDTLRKLGELSPAERETITSGRFAGDFTPDALLDQMRTLARFDASNDSTRGRIKGLLVALVVLSIVGFFVFKFLPNAVSRPVVVVPLLLLDLGAVAFLWITLRRLRNVDISNNFRDVALPFLAVLKQDMDPDRTITVRIDLREPLHATKLKGTSQPYKAGAYHKIVDTTYVDPWFHGRAELADGSRLTWTVYDTIVKSTRTKRSASNKTKTKTRHVKRSQVAIALAVANKRYGVARMPSADEGKLAVAAGAKRSTIKLVRKLKTKSLDPIDPRLLIDAVSGAYQRVVAPTRSAAA